MRAATPSGVEFHAGMDWPAQTRSFLRIAAVGLSEPFLVRLSAMAKALSRSDAMMVAVGFQPTV